MKKLIFTVLGLTLLLTSCSKEGGKTQAKVNLLSGISSLTGSYGAGGTILFGKSSKGESFGKVVAGSEENLTLPNGDWKFFAFMWEMPADGKMMSGQVRCAKTAANLGGTDVTLNFNLTNANCSDGELSNGRTYSEATTGIVRFADIFVDECDDFNSNDSTRPNWFCGQDNQGSAMSYRLKFQSFKQGLDGVLKLGPDTETILGACKVPNKNTNELLNAGLGVNFPSGNGATPFVVAIEMFLGTDNCTVDAKGSHHVILNKGLGEKAYPEANMVYSTSNCPQQNITLPGIATPEEIQNKKNVCNAYMGSLNNNDCFSIPATTSRFMPDMAILCSSKVAAAPAIKHIVTIPRDRLCGPFQGKSAALGGNPFAGGNGLIERPYKICNEWQINQIGEYDSDISFANKFYKLMNDLDMNKTDFGEYNRPKCVGATGAIVKEHHNLNPLDKLNYGDCATLRMAENNGFQGEFNGNNKIIKNARIAAESVLTLGFIRELYNGAIVKNLNFKNLEVRGKSRVGGVIGYAGDYSRIAKIKIDGLDVEGRSNGGTEAYEIGGIVGLTGNSVAIENVVVKDARVRGREKIGGIAGSSSANLFQVGFRGTIDHDDGSGNYIGGLVGQGMSGSIKESFSEGIINSRAYNTGGIIGQTSSLTISSVYSTMVINSKYSSTGASIGGISGQGGSVIDVYFDGAINHTGGSAPSISGVAVGSSGSNCYSSVSPTTGGCSVLTYAALRDGTTPTFTSSSSSPWIKTSGSTPRFGWEKRDCALAENQDSFDAQILAGRGGQTKPLVICNSSQLKATDGSGSNLYYRIADDINLSNWTVLSNLISQFKGNLNGDHHILYGANVTDATNSAADYIGLFRENSGFISRLVVASNKINSLSEELGSGVLVGKNTGVINDIELNSNELMGYSSAGQLAGINEKISGVTNSGIINLVDVQEGKIIGHKSYGGLVGVNGASAVITRASVRLMMGHYTTPYDDYEKIGGIVGVNNGHIGQSMFSGEFKSNNLSTVANGILELGGLVGLNNGTIVNSFTDSYSRLNVKNIASVGGLIGHNSSTGTISKSFNLGKAFYDSSASIATAGADFHPAIGKDEGSSGDFVFWLENSIASKLGQTMSTSFSAGPPQTISISGAGSSADLFMSTYGHGGEITTLIPMTYASTDTFTFSGDIFPNSTDISYFKKYAYPADSVRTLPVDEFKDVNVFCTSWAGSSAPELTCNNGFDVVFSVKANPAGNIGYKRLIDYYKAIMDETSIPTNAPIWELESEEGYPRLVQLKHH